MKRWSEFAVETPGMAEAGRALLYQFRVGLGYLATVRRDGGPRVHPVCPVIAHGGLYVFVGNHSPKAHDLLRDGRFALHAFPHEVDDEFYVSERARRRRCSGPAGRLRRVYGDRCLRERRHAVRALAGARPARQVRPASKLASDVHQMVRRRIRGANQGDRRPCLTFPRP
jgi:Pyridoxamine 5'-phosphate oxidase